MKRSLEIIRISVCLPVDGGLILEGFPHKILSSSSTLESRSPGEVTFIGRAKDVGIEN